jgi:hypothetical protein
MLCMNEWMNVEWMFIDHSIDPYMGRSPIGCRARPNTQYTKQNNQNSKRPYYNITT